MPTGSVIALSLPVPLLSPKGTTSLHLLYIFAITYTYFRSPQEHAELSHYAFLRHRQSLVSRSRPSGRREDAPELGIAARAEASHMTVRAINPFDQTYPWPEDSVTGGGQSAQFQAKNLGNGDYSFTFWHTGPLNGGDLNYRVSYGGKELAKKVLSPRGTATVTVPKTGDNFNISIEDA